MFILLSRLWRDKLRLGLFIIVIYNYWMQKVCVLFTQWDMGLNYGGRRTLGKQGDNVFYTTSRFTTVYLIE